MQTGILVRINNQSFSCATLNGNGMGLCTVVPPEDEDAEAEVEGGMFEGRVGGDLAGEDTGCGLSHITPHSVPGWPSVTTQIQPREEKHTHQIQVSQMFESIYKYFFSTTALCSPDFLWQCNHVLLVPIPVYLLSVLISLPTSIRSLTTDHVIIQLTQHQITSGSAWQLPIHISLFVSWGVGQNITCICFFQRRPIVFPPFLFFFLYSDVQK